MKYKLLKEYPRIEIGCIGELNSSANHYRFTGKGFSLTIDREIVESSPDWFEPVSERWRAIDGGVYYVLSNLFSVAKDVQEHKSLTDMDRFQVGNYFKTREQAEEASRRIKKVLMDYHKEIGE